MAFGNSPTPLRSAQHDVRTSQIFRVYPKIGAFWGEALTPKRFLSIILAASLKAAPNTWTEVPIPLGILKECQTLSFTPFTRPV